MRTDKEIKDEVERINRQIDVAKQQMLIFENNLKAATQNLQQLIGARDSLLWSMQSAQAVVPAEKKTEEEKPAQPK